MVDISSQNNKINVTVSSNGNTANTNVTPDYAQYYSEKSKEWAISNKIVDNTDYSSKYYAGESKKQADISTAKTTEVIESGNTAVSNIESVRDNAIIDITNQETISKNILIDEGATQVANVNSAGTTQINLAKEQVTLATNQANIATEQATIATNKASEVVASGNEALANIDTAKNNAITSITTQETTSKTVLIDEGATQVRLIKNEGATQIANVQSTGFYMRDDKLYYINSQGEETEFKSGGSGLEICDIGMALYVDETKGLRRRLNGSIMDITSNYQAFLTRLLEIKTTNPEYFTDEATWQSEATLNVDGCVYKFVLNYDSTGTNVVSVRLPKYPDYVEINAGGTLPVVGNGIALGLTNGTKSGSLVSYTNGYNLSYLGTLGHNVGLGDAGSSIPPAGWYGITSDPTKSGIQTTLKQTKLKLRYFIQIATGAETENNIINEIELNNPYSLFDSKYSDHELNNLSWLKSEGQWNAKAVYTDAYDKLLKVYNGTETVVGLSVKLSTETYTDYDFVLNTAEETFRLPLLDGSEDLVSDKFISQGFTATNRGYIIPITKNGQIGIRIYDTTATDVTVSKNGKAVGSFNLQSNIYRQGTITTQVIKGDKIRVFTNASGTTANCNYLFFENTGNGSLYYYVGETVQNANLIDAGRIGEQLATKTDMLQASGAGMPSNKYIGLTLGASGSTYTAPANGWFCCGGGPSTGSGIISFEFNKGLYQQIHADGAGQYLGLIRPALKGDTLTINYGNMSGLFLNFIYAQGSEGEV